MRASSPAWKRAYPLGYTDARRTATLAPQYVIERLGAIAGPEAIYVAGVGQHQMWAAQFVEYERPNTWINSGGLGTMGFAVPAAMGAKVGRARPHGLGDRRRRLLPDDQPGARHLRINDIPIKVAIINNAVARHGAPVADAVLQRALLQHRPAHHGRPRIPDFVKLAEAYGCVGLRVRAPRGRRRHDQARRWRSTTVPVVVDFVVHRDAMVWPMVAAGTSNDDIQYRPRPSRPTWERGRRD